MCVTMFESAMKINLPLVLCHHGPLKKKKKKKKNQALGTLTIGF